MHYALARGRIGPPPASFIERRARRCHSGVYICGTAAGDLGYNTAVHGADVVEHPAVAGPNELAVDEGPAFRTGRRGELLPILAVTCCAGCGHLNSRSTSGWRNEAGPSRRPAGGSSGAWPNSPAAPSVRRAARQG